MIYDTHLKNAQQLHLESQLLEASYQLLNHGVVAFPTETVMGLGCVYDDEYAYNRLNAIKRRPEDKPYSLMVENPEQISLFAKVNNDVAKVIEAFLPGPLTLLLPVKKGVPSWVTHGGSTIGIRVSSCEITAALLKYTGKPLLAPSANHSGLSPAMSSDQVREYFKEDEGIDYIVDGNAEGGLPSTIIDMTGPDVVIVREGPITLEMIKKVLGK